MAEDEERLIKMAVPETDEAANSKAMQSANALTNAEVNILLSKYELSKRHEHGEHWQPHPHVVKTRKFLEKLKLPVNEQAVQAVRSQMNRHPLYEYELVLLANLMPESGGEAMALIPSLKDGRFSVEELDNVLGELQDLEHA